MNEIPILIVEDEAIVAADLASKLGRLGYPVVGTVARGAEAIALVRERSPALVLMDIRIAGPMDGVETAEHIRRECDVPVVYLTAHSDRMTLQRAKLTEPFGYILKPFDERELEICLQMALFKHQTQRQLSESEARFRAAFEDGAIAMVMTGLDTKLQKVNPAFCQMLGYTAEELVDHSFTEFMHPDDLAENRAGLQRMINGECQSFRMEKRYIRKDGGIIWGDMSTAAIRDSSGKPLYIVTHIQDITARKRAEEALRASAGELQAANQTLNTSRRAALNLMIDAQAARRQAELIAIELEKREEQLRIFVEHAPAAIAMLDTDMRYVATSRRWLADYGMTGQDVRGQCHYDLFPEIPERWKAIHRRCLAGAVERAEEDPFDRPDGTRQWIHWEVRPWNVAPGMIGGIVIFSEDITPRKKAEQALRESEERYKSLFSRMTEGFAIHEIITDANGHPVDFRFLDINPAFENLTGLKRADVVGKTHNEVLPGDDPKWVSLYGSVALTGEPVHLENYSPPLRRYYEVFAYCPAPRQFAVIFMDITERKKSEARIARLTQLYAVLSRVNEAIVRIRDEQALYGEVCRVIAEEGHFPLVWIGLQRDQQVVLIASAGPSADYLKSIRVEVEGPLGMGPTGTALREDRTVVNADFDSNPTTAPWRESALRYEFRSSAAFPLHRQGKPIGAITLYSPQPDVFDPEQIRLLESLSSDLSFALDSITQEQLRLEIEVSLRASEKREKEDAIRLAWGQSAIDTINVMNEGVILLEMDGTILSINPAVERLTGLTGGSVVGRNLQSLLPDFLEKTELKRTLRRLVVFRRGRIPELPMLQLRRSDGKSLYVLPSLSLMNAPEGERRVAVLTLKDMTELHESAQKLERSERKYRELVENANSIIMRITRDHTIIFFNEYAQRLFGFSENEVLGRNVIGTIAPEVDSAGRDLSAMFRAITDDPDRYASNENENICKDGRRVWIHWTNRAVRDELGQLVEFLCVGTDITERRQAEVRAKATNAMLALFARKTARADYVSAVTDLMKELVGCRCVGLRIRNAVGEIPYEASTGFDAQFLESESRIHLSRDECACTRIVSERLLPCDRSSLSPGGSFFCNDTPTLIASLAAADRGVFRGICLKHGFTSIAVLPIRYHDETLGAIHLADERAGVFSPDVINFMETIMPLIGEAVHRFNVEVELRKNEARYRSLVVASAQIVWSTNAAGEVTDDLPLWRAYTGQSRAEILGWGWSNAIHEEDRRRATDAWAHAVATRSLYDTEIRIRGADGEHRDFAVRGVPVIDPDGTLREWVGTCTDITQRKGMEAEASRYREQLRALAKELVASEEQERWQISRYIHDTIIQNLSLSSMRLGAFQKKLAATPGDTEGPQIATTRKLVDDAIAECRTVMSELTPPLLNELGLVPALEELVETLQQRYGVPIEVESQGLSKPMDNALRGLLFQSARELVMNALKHAGPCSIRVTVADSVDGVLIRVQDNGRGFDPGRKKSHDMKEGGFGLFSVRERVEGMGGQLAIESAPGQGVTATIALPIPESG